MANTAKTEDVTRSVVILGYSGVQALDLVGPFDVFTGATLHLASQGRTTDGYRATLVSIDGQPVATLHRDAVRFRHRGNHAPQFRSAAGDFTRPIPKTFA